jgi:DNA-binding transcriptional regulator GbsR (MarR family)
MLKEKDMTAGEIADNFQMSNPSISHHLSILKQAEKAGYRQKERPEYLLFIDTRCFRKWLNWFFNMTDRSGGLKMKLN